METKFNIGEKVYFKYSGNLSHGVICNIRVDKKIESTDKTDEFKVSDQTSYSVIGSEDDRHVKNPVIINESEMFKRFEDLISHLDNG